MDNLWIIYGLKPCIHIHVADIIPLGHNHMFTLGQFTKAYNTCALLGIHLDVEI